MSDSEDSYGPALPPGMQQSTRSDEDTSSDNDQYGPVIPNSSGQGHQGKGDTNKYCIGPVLPARKPESVKGVIGPVLPGNFSKKSRDSSDSDSDSSASSSSSSSSSGQKSKREKKHRKLHTSKSDHYTHRHVIGPVMPPSIGQSSEKLKGADNRVIGPSMLPGIQGSDSERNNDSSDDDDDVIGPHVGLQASAEDQSAVKDFESRSQRMMEKLTSSTKPDESEAPKQRESWMTELPEEGGASFGLSSRQFRTKDAPEIDSSWTEAPHEKGKKNKEGKKRKKDKEDCFQSDRDKKAKKEIEAFNKKHRAKSLLEMHEKKLKKKKKKEKKKNKDKPMERRPFDRDIDLKVNKFDDAMKKAYIKKTQELGSRFKSGGTGTSFL